MIKLLNINKSYGDKKILNNVNLSINSGEITFIVGTSGAGKTTLLNIIGGLDNPTSGSVIFNGKDIKEDLGTYRAKNIGFVFQDFNLISGLTIVQNVEIATAFSGIQKDTKSIIDEIKALGISNPNQKVETLSGGEKQRAAVIRSICKDADIIIADEPTGNLDSGNASLVLELLQSLKLDKHIIVVSHDIEKADEYADRIITLSDGNIVSDKTVNKKQENQVKSNQENNYNEIKTSKRFFLNTLLLLGKNSVMLRKRKIISIAFVIALAIASLATVINLNQSGNEISQSVNVNYLENDLINLYYSYTPNTGYREMPFSIDDIELIKNNYELNESVLIYLNESNEWNFSVGSKTSDVCIKQININDFFKDRVLSNDIEGEFLKNSNEIIIAEDVAEQLFDETCIGKKVMLNNGSGSSIELTVVGVNHTINPFDNMYSFISAESLKDLLSKSIQASLFERQELMTYYTEIQSMTTGGLYGSMSPIEKNENLLYGKNSNSDEEILVSSELLLNILGDFDIETNYSQEDINNGKILSDDLKKIFSKKFAINFNGLFTVYISGIYLSEEIEMRFPDELIEELKILDPITIDIYATNPAQVTEIKDSINKNYDFEASTQLETLKDNISMQTRFFSIALILLGIVLLLISISLLSSFSKIAVFEREKEVAIIKSLGGNNRSVLLILLFDFFVITLLSFFLALIMFIILKFAMPVIIPDIDLLSSGYPLGLIIMISAIFSLLVYMQISITLRKLVKKMPAELFTR